MLTSDEARGRKCLRSIQADSVVYVKKIHEKGHQQDDPVWQHFCKTERLNGDIMQSRKSKMADAKVEEQTQQRLALRGHLPILQHEKQFIECVMQRMNYSFKATMARASTTLIFQLIPELLKNSSKFSSW